MRQKHLALRRAVDRQTRADVGHDAQRAARLHLIERDNAAALADREHDGRARLLAQKLHIGPRDKGDIPRALDMAAIFKEPQPQRVLAVRGLRDHVVGPHGGQQAEDRAFRIAALRGQLLERQGLFRLTQKLQQLHGLCNGQYDIPIHHGAPAPFLTSIAVSLFSVKNNPMKLTKNPTMPHDSFALRGQSMAR